MKTGCVHVATMGVLLSLGFAGCDDGDAVVFPKTYVGTSHVEETTCSLLFGERESMTIGQSDEVSIRVTLNEDGTLIMSGDFFVECHEYALANGTFQTAPHYVITNTPWHVDGTHSGGRFEFTSGHGSRYAGTYDNDSFQGTATFAATNNSSVGPVYWHYVERFLAAAE